MVAVLDFSVDSHFELLGGLLCLLRELSTVTATGLHCKVGVSYPWLKIPSSYNPAPCDSPRLDLARC